MKKKRKRRRMKRNKKRKLGLKNLNKLVKNHYYLLLKKSLQ